MNPNGGPIDTTQPQPAASKPTPVMDVVAPHAEPAPGAPLPVATPPDESTGAAAPAQESPDKLIEEEAKEFKGALTAVPVKAPKQRGNGVGLAIFGTIVIILALSALATFAYMQSR